MRETVAAALFIYKKKQHHFKKLEIIRSIISVNTTPTTVHSLFLRVKTFIFFSFSLSSMTFFFPPLPDTPLDGVCFSHSYSHKGGDPLSPVWDPRNFLGWHDSGFTQGLLWPPQHHGTSQVLPSLIDYLSRGGLSKHGADSQVLRNRGTAFGYQLKRIAVTSA